MESLQQKQKYLRQNITEEQYEEFTEYLKENVGNYEIEAWSGEFLSGVVHNFKEALIKQGNQHETSFYQYQASKEEKSVHSAKTEGHPTNYKHQAKGLPEKVVVAPVANGSALNLFDSLFVPATTSVIKPIPVVPPLPVKIPPISELPFKTVDPTYFDNKQFWGLQLGGSNTARSKPNKASVDFANFDFWSQPSSANNSPTEYKSVGYQPAASKSGDLVKEKVIPSFEELMQNQKQSEKAPSPYLKKSYPEEKPAVAKAGKVIYDGEMVIKSNFKDSVKCFPSAERKQFSHPELSVVIQNHEIVQRTFLMPDYVMYSMRVKPLNIVCKRNYEDFTRLRATLCALYPGIKMSYLEKNSWFYSTNIEFIKKQKAMLEFFLNDLIQHKEIRNSRILEDFLTLQEHKKIKRKFEQYEKLEKPKAIEELCLMEGKVQVDISENQRLYQENLKKYHERMISMLEKQEKLSETLAQQYKEAKLTLQSLSELANTITEQTLLFNKKVYDLQLDGVEQVFKMLKSCYNQEAATLQSKIQQINSQIIPFLIYQKENLYEFTDLINIQQSFFKTYLKRSQSEKIDASIPYTSDKIKNTKGGVLVESKNLLVLKYQTGYLSNQVCHEAKRIFETLGRKYRSVWEDYSQRSRDQSLKELQFWKALVNPHALSP